MRNGGATDSIWPQGPTSPRVPASFAEAEPSPYWFDTVPDPAGSEAWTTGAELRDGDRADLVVVGGGLTGLWTALLAKQQDPGLDLVLLESEQIAFGASGRNGGFISSSLTHGIENGLARVPEEMQTLERLGRENFDTTITDLQRHGIECDFERHGALSVALTETELQDLAQEVATLQRFGHQAGKLDGDQVRGLIDSPTYRGAVWHRNGEGLVNPVKLCRGLARAATDLGARIEQGAKVTSLSESPAGSGVELTVNHQDGPDRRLNSGRVILATAAFPGLLPAIRRRVVPVYDYVLVTEPLSAAQRAAIGWELPIGVSDRGNQFHYYRPTADGRILWGGYDAVYHFGNGLGPQLDQRQETFTRLAAHFFHTFPQLEGVRFSHRWGGAIDTCSRFAAFYGTGLGGKVTYAVGHTGLGVGASRFSASVALDLSRGRRSQATALRFVRSRPIPFPPEPLRWAVIELTRNRLAAADSRDGRRGVWLRLLDRLGLGFDS